MRVVLRADGDLDELTLQINLDWRGGQGAATHGLEVLGANPNLLLDRSDGAAHFIPASAKVAAAYVEGQPVRAICGRRFVPTADPSTAPTCPECQRIREQIEQAHRVD